MIIDGPPSPTGNDSVIVAVGKDSLSLLRPGDIPIEDLAQVAGLPIRQNGATVTLTTEFEEAGKIQSFEGQDDGKIRLRESRFAGISTFFSERSGSAT